MGSKVSTDNITTVGDNVNVKLGSGICAGIVRFIGPIQGKKGVFYGIELNEPKGKNNGSVSDHFYFPKVEDKKGSFVTTTNILNTDTSNNKHALRITVGDKVKAINANCTGIVKWIGIPDFSKKGIFYGIELEKPNGKSNGTVKNKFYFKCNDKYATFVQAKSVSILQSETNSETNENINEPEISKVERLADYYNSLNVNNSAIKPQIVRKPVRRRNVKTPKTDQVEFKQQFKKFFDTECKETIATINKEKDELRKLEEEMRKIYRKKMILMCMAFLVVLIAVGIGVGILVWKTYYINEEFESEMRCYNFMTMTEPRFTFMGLLYYHFNNFMSVRIEDPATKVIDGYEYAYNNLKFDASVSQFEGLELEYHTDKFDDILIAYKCDSATRTQALGFSYNKFAKSSLHVDRSKGTQIDVYYLRIFVEKIAENNYNAKCGVVNASYNFPHAVTDASIRNIIEKVAKPRFEKDLTRPDFADFVKKNI